MSAAHGVREIELDGETVYVAVGPVAILRWLDQVAGDETIEHGDVCFALALQSFVNGKDGFTFATQEAIGLKARVSERTARRRLDRLIARGHVLQQRRARKAAVMHLVLDDRPASGRSNDIYDRPASGRSKPVRPDNGVHHDRTAACAMTGQPEITSGCNESDCGPLTYRLNLPTITQAGAAALSSAPQAPADETVIAERETANAAGSIAPLEALSPAPDPPPKQKRKYNRTNLKIRLEIIRREDAANLYPATGGLK